MSSTQQTVQSQTILETDEYNCPIFKQPVKTADGYHNYRFVIGGKQKCKCGGSYSKATFDKHRTTKRCLKHQATRICKAIKASKGQDEAHDACRNVPTELADSVKGTYAHEMLQKILTVMFAHRETYDYDPTHA